MTQPEHRVCNACIRTNEYVAREGVSWHPGFCSVCLKEKRFTVPLSDVRDPKEGMALIVWMVGGWIFALAAGAAVWRAL